MINHPKFREAVQLFNDGYYWHSHEAWEVVWHESGGDDKRFVQGLIQLAGALHHHESGNGKGRDSLRRTAGEKFTGLSPVFHGLDWADLLKQVDGVFADGVSRPPVINLRDMDDKDLRRRIDLMKDPRASTFERMAAILALAGVKDALAEVIKIARFSEKEFQMVKETSALGVVSEKLTDLDREIRFIAMEYFISLGEDAAPALEILRQALRHPEEIVANKAAWALGRVGSAAEAAIPDLIQAMQTGPVWLVRAAAAGALGEIGKTTPQVLTALQAAAASPDNYLSLRAAESLSRLSAPRTNHA